jgi:hypothetical protein
MTMEIDGAQIAHAGRQHFRRSMCHAAVKDGGRHSQYNVN